jgi:hypothetical protein
MLKATILAALLGISTAYSVVSRNDAGSIVSGNMYYSLSYSWLADGGIETTYNAYEDSTTGYKYEGYGVEAYGWVNITITQEFFQFYKQSMMLSVMPFRIVPYQQEFFWTRPVSSKKFTIGASAFRNIMLAQVLTTIYINAKTCVHSEVDWMRSGTFSFSYANNCAYDDTQAAMYEDPYWNSTYLLNKAGVNFSTMWSSWYGKHTYFTQTFF